MASRESRYYAKHALAIQRTCWTIKVRCFMKTGKGLLPFSCFVVCAGVFVWFTSARLPALVASHFAGSGAANGFIPHSVYVYFMLGFVVGLPAGMVVLTWLAMASPKAHINLPDKDYWLAP